MNVEPQLSWDDLFLLAREHVDLTVSWRVLLSRGLYVPLDKQKTMIGAGQLQQCYLTFKDENDLCYKKKNMWHHSWHNGFVEYNFIRERVWHSKVNFMLHFFSTSLEQLNQKGWLTHPSPVSSLTNSLQGFHFPWASLTVPCFQISYGFCIYFPQIS